MTRARSPKLGLYGAIGAAALASGLLAGRPALVALAAPFVLFCGAALLGPALREPTGALRLGAARAVEGGRVEVAVEVSAEAAARIEVAVRSSAGVRVEGSPVAVAGDGTSTTLMAECERWGAHRVGPLLVRVSDVLGAWWIERPVAAGRSLRVYPSEVRLRSLVAPRRTQPLTGSRRSRARGEGVEYADVREYVPGDPLRRIHWRASARRGRLYVTERHPERNADVVLLVDGSAELRGRRGSSLDETVRATAALARHYLAARDRVTLVGASGGVWWLTGGLGERQRYRIAEALLEGGRRITYVWDAATIDRRALPTGALVLALTPLLSRRMVDTLRELRARGRDVAALVIDPAGYLEPVRDRRAQLAVRLWSIERAADVRSLQRAGIPVASWEPQSGLEVALARLERWRRAA